MQPCRVTSRRQFVDIDLWFHFPSLILVDLGPGKTYRSVGGGENQEQFPHAGDNFARGVALFLQGRLCRYFGA
jgi:hypothetical protein